MKINEIIEPRDVERPISKDYNIEKMGQRPEDFNEFGAYANGTEDPLDAHMYRKKIRMPSNLNNDAYFQWIKACSPFMKSNPWLPRVYEVVLKKYKDGYVRPSYNMEKLIPISTAIIEIGEQELTHLLANKIYTPEVLAYREEHYTTYNDMWLILSDISKSVYDGNTTINDFSDPGLHQALSIVNRLTKDNGNFTVDMHKGNFMIRLGTTGPQLVITDPLADGGKSIAAGWNPFNNRMVGQSLNIPGGVPPEELPF